MNAPTTTLTIRRATAADQAEIAELVRRERLNPNGIFWARFVVASEGGRIVGAAQIRGHGDDARELGSLVVAPEKRGAGLAGRLIQALLSMEDGAVYMVTGRTHAAHYARWGFQPVRRTRVPASVFRNYCLGQMIGGMHAMLKGRPINRLVVLKCDDAGLYADHWLGFSGASENAAVVSFG